MAHRTDNHSDLEIFRNRIWQLLESRNIKSVRQLASEFYDKKLIVVCSRKTQTADKRRKSAIDSIEHRINKHLSSDRANTLQAEYAIAYVKFFDCSFDYLYGLTKIKAYYPNVRQTCEYLELSEDSIKTLKYRGDVFNKFGQSNKRDLLNELLSSHSFRDFLSEIYEIDFMYEQLIVEKNKIQLEIENVSKQLKNSYSYLFDYTEEVEEMDFSKDDFEKLALLEKYSEKLYSLNKNYDYSKKVHKYELSEIYVKMINTLMNDEQ